MLSRCFRSRCFRSRCFRRTYASRSGWQPSSKRSPAQQPFSRPQGSLDEPAPHRPSGFAGFKDALEEASRTAKERSRVEDTPKAERASRPADFVAIGAAFLVSIFLANYLFPETTQKQDVFQPYTLFRKQPVSSSMSIFYLNPGTNVSVIKSFRESWEKGIWNVLFKQPQIQVVRAYTPLPPHPGEEMRQSLRFLIRHDEGGEVSTWLNRLPAGSKIEMKGPNPEMEIPSWTQHITFLAGGTGIATALQAAHALLSRSQSDTLLGDRSTQPPTIHILWASRRREDCKGGISDRFASVASKVVGNDHARDAPTIADRGLIVQELDALKARYPKRVFVDYYVDEENTRIIDETVTKSIGAFGQSAQANGTATHQIIVSGPDGFINHLAGPKIWREGGQDQGPLGGVVAQALTRTKNAYQVWKV